ncbi:MAG: putative DNA binding domain-containing protein [Campylobacter sp.]|nr:putative DNA binding domain-containing protein [Campylobacter sp.]
MNNKPNAYIIWGIDNKTHAIVGTNFKPLKAKNGGENLDNWLLRLLEPKIDYKFYEIIIENKDVVLLEIASADKHPVSFKGKEYIRHGENKKNLKSMPERERELWRAFDKTPFEKQIAADNLEINEVLNLLDYKKYFELLEIPLSQNNETIMEYLIKDNIVVKLQNKKYSITNLGAILFARHLSKFENLRRKSIRVIQYKEIQK